MHSSLRSSAELKRTINFPEDFHLNLIRLMCNDQKTKKLCRTLLGNASFKSKFFRENYIYLYTYPYNIYI